ncbi:MAG: type II toxin-antitoxin system RelE/ParE family toxin [Candidatus Vogelbacteria bacterium]|nr:type II toxin-antitoxin system RelE/ParE family toxin [Candidatus Vogelbacteria bacterium]
MPEAYKLRIREALREIVADPFSGKKLDGKHKGEYSARVWPYRIIYKIYKKELLILIIDVDHRGHHVY